MIIHEAKFVISSTDVAKCPKTKLPEYAFIGRSNVGKSSLINMLTGYNKLAKTSGRPGKTQLINHFIINDKWYIVDLPGYGYAKTSQSNRIKWEEFIRKYLMLRENLFCVFVLIDSRHEPLKNDLDFMTWLGENGVPFVIAFTKTDKLNTVEMQTFKNQYSEKLSEYWDELPKMFVTSAEKQIGRDEILDFIEATNNQ